MRVTRAGNGTLVYLTTDFEADLADIDAHIASGDADRVAIAKRTVDVMLRSRSLLNPDMRAAVQRRIPFLADKLRAA